MNEIDVAIEPYDLPDNRLFLNEGPDLDICVWQPDKTVAVLGRGDKPDSSLFMEKVLRDQIKIVQRPSGGHAVIITEKMLVVSIALRRDPQPASKDFFRNCNAFIIRAFFNIGVFKLGQKGISDIVLGEKKIAGTAIYRNKYLIFYHAIINLGESGYIFERYLKYPQKVPEYRKSRKHSDFITSFHAEGIKIDMKKLKKELFLKDNYSFF